MSRERFEVGALQAHLEARRAKSRSRRSKAAEASVALAIAHPPTVWAAFSRAVQALTLTLTLTLTLILTLALTRTLIVWAAFSRAVQERLGLAALTMARHTYHACFHEYRTVALLTMAGAA